MPYAQNARVFPTLLARLRTWRYTLVANLASRRALERRSKSNSRKR